MGERCSLLPDRAGGEGGFDLYRSAIGEKGWVPPAALVGLNSPGSERAPAPSPSGFEMVLSVDSGQGADLYRARSLELFREPGRPVGWRDLLLLLLLLVLALLAWLAKRWEQMDALYKCFLASVVVHLFLLFWLRDVHPDQSVYDLHGEGTRMPSKACG